MTRAVSLTGEAVIRAMPALQLAQLQEFQRMSLGLPQIDPATQHLISAGMYHRTVRMPANTVMVGALIKIPTTVTISGDVTVWLGDGELRITGYRVMAAAAKRKQAFIAHAETFITMSFVTHTLDVAEAEAEFTDEHTLLQSRRFRNQVVITNIVEPSCPGQSA